MNDPITNHRQRARRQAQLPPNAACSICGITNLDVLVKHCSPATLLEAHHIFGRAHHPLTGTLCRNHHAIATAACRNEGVALAASRTFLDTLVNALLALGALLIEIGKALLAWARELLRRLGLLTTVNPIWRDPWTPQ